MAYSNNSNNSDSFFARLADFAKALAAGFGGLIGDADLVRLADYCQQQVLLEIGELPFTKGVAKIAALSFDPEAILKELTARLEGATLHSVKSGGDGSYVSIHPTWWAKTKLDAALLLAAS